MKYNYGELDNNKDEYYYGTCRKCGNGNSWEPNYDDYDWVYRILSNNIIAFGDYLQFNKIREAKSGDVSKEKFEEIAKGLETFEVQAPTLKWLNKIKLQEYLSEAISEINSKK